MPIQFRNLVFEEGGTRGIAYVGAMSVIEEHGALNHICRVGGIQSGIDCAENYFTWF